MNKISIVMYHYVRDLKNSKFPQIKGLDLYSFHEQVLYLKKNYNIIRIEDLILSIDHGVKLPDNAALLTFDDGYIDHYQNVMPFLLKHDLQGSFYIPSSTVDEGKVLDVNKIHFILAKVNDHKILVREIYSYVQTYLPNIDCDKLYNETSKIGYILDNSDIRFIKQSLQVRLPESIRTDLTKFLFEKYVDNDEINFSKSLYISRKQIKEMLGNGMHIGSHSHNHEWLGSKTKTTQRIELNKSVDFLYSLGIDTNNLSICYPYGSYNQDTISIAKDIGFKVGFSTVPGVADLDADFLALARLDTNDLPKVSS